VAKDAIALAQERQTHQANKHRRPVDIEVGDWVLVEHEALLNLSEKDRPSHKGRPLLAGPFQTIKRSRDGNAFTLMLPPSSRAHPTFNVSKLVKYMKSPAEFASRPPPKVTSKDADGPLYTVEELLEKRFDVASKQVQYRVKWLHYDESTWEPRSELMKTIPLVIEAFDAKLAEADQAGPADASELSRAECRRSKRARK
jgi:hypothetical protein